MDLIKEHHDYGIKPELLSLDFIAGLIVGEGTFYWTTVKKTNKKIPVFALRMHIRDFELLTNVKYSLGVQEKVYEYQHGGRHYSFLILRSYASIRKIIKDIYPRLTGYKKLQFLKWFKGFKDSDRFESIYYIFKSIFPELYM